MRPLRIAQTVSRSTVRLGQELGKGGEGIVYAVEGRNDLAAKIYDHHRAAERRDKILSMVAAKWHQQISEVAFPIEPLFDSSRLFVGFSMRKVDARGAIHQAYSPTSRKSTFPKATFPFLVRIALNVANAIAKVHATGCVIGDINHSSVLIADNGTVTLIDSDSFQVRASGHVFPCRVGVPEFTPPELQDKPLNAVFRSANHDAFGLAVLIFYILFMGKHPFAGRPTTAGDPPELRVAIRDFRFAYSTRQTQTLMEPPPHAPTLKDVPPSLAALFETAFGPTGAANVRPTAAEWATALDGAERELTRCRDSSAHHHFKTATACPWCRMEGGFPGFVAFRQDIAFPTSAKIDVAHLIATIQRVADPGPAPELATLMPQSLNLRPSGEAAAARMERHTRYAVGVAGVVAGVAMMAATKGGGFLGLLAMGASIIYGISTPKSVRNLQERRAITRQEWAKLERQWQDDAGNARFLSGRRDAEELLRQFQQLPTEEQRRLRELEFNRREAQKQRFLERHLIMPAKIKGLGNVRKIRLQSYGIESAADITALAVRRVPGCSSIASALVSWRRSIERRFVFDPSIPVDQADITAVRSTIASKQAELEKKVRLAISRLHETRNKLLALRGNAASYGTAASAWMALKQAETDLAAA